MAMLFTFEKLSGLQAWQMRDDISRLETASKRE